MSGGPDQSERQLPVSVPDHQLLRRIGRGSYGDVWLARHTMGMFRAVKIVHRKAFDHQRPFDREISGIRRFEPISRSHEGFVDILHVGINNVSGYFYYVMELGDDQTSAQNIDPLIYSPKTLAKEISVRGKLSAQECLELGLALSQALAELHKHGLIHRDIKPSNIIFVNGVPKLADIGLVAGVNEARSYVGTEGFIPPEGPGTPQADVYSLGKVLYEASTGKDRQDFPELPTQLETLEDSEKFLELNEVILQACKNERSKRYQTAWDMHANLLVMANGKSIRRLKILERRWANLKRIAGFGALVLIVVAAITYSIYRERKIVVESRQRQVGASVAYGIGAMESGDLLGALPFLANALRLDKGDATREINHRLRLGCVLAQCPKLTDLWFAGERVNDAEFSPDGQRVLIARSSGKVEIYDPKNGNSYSHQFGKKDALSSASYSPDGRFVVVASHDGNAYISTTADLKEAFRLPHPSRVFCARFSPDGLHIVTACKDGVARIWDARDGKLEFTLKKHTDAVLFAVFSNDGRMIITTSYDTTARLWDAKDGRSLGSPLEHGNWVTYAAFSPDGQMLVTACSDHKARVWDVATRRRIMPDLLHRDGVKSVEFSPDGRLIVTASLDGTVRLWATENLQPIDPNPILRHGERVTHAGFSPDGRRILTTCIDGSLRIWDLAGSIVAPLPVRGSFSQDGSRFLAVTNNSLQVWNTTSGKTFSPRINLSPGFQRAELNRTGDFLMVISESQSNSNEAKQVVQVLDVVNGKAVAPTLSIPPSLEGASLSDDGRRLVTYEGRSAQTWDVLACKAFSPPLLHNKTIGSALFNRSANRIVTTSGVEVRVWDALNGRLIFKPLKHPTLVAYAEFSPDGSQLVTCCSDKLLDKWFAQIWDATTGQPVGSQLNHGDGVLFASFSQDGRRVVTASEDFTAVVWGAATGKLLTPALNHQEKVQTAMFNPGGKWIVTASSDKTARVWSAENGDPLTPPLRHLAPLTSARFLADSRRLITSDIQGDTRIWILPINEWPLDDLVRLIRLLSGNTPTGSEGLIPPRSDSIEAIWQELHQKYPSNFIASNDEIDAWHEFKAEEAELKRNWFAAAFHLGQLLVIRPNDSALVGRLTVVKMHLAERN